jgi:LemA protein
MNIIFIVLAILLLISGFFDLIDWKFNIPALAVLFVFWIVAIYNGFINLRNRVEEAWADIEVQLKRRYDLIPNLVNTVKGYATHESSAFENVTKARSAAMGASGPTPEHAQAENMLTGALKSIFALAEAYPDLKANQNFLALQNELSDTENKIQAARRFYNTNVRDLNTSVESFPSNIVAGVFKFAKKEFFDLADDDVAQKNVEVKF